MLPTFFWTEGIIIQLPGNIISFLFSEIVTHSISYRHKKSPFVDFFMTLFAFSEEWEELQEEIDEVEIEW